MKQLCAKTDFSIFAFIRVTSWLNLVQFSRILSYIKGADIEIFLAAFQTVLQALLSAVITVSEELERLKACGRTTFTCIMNLSSNESHLDDCLPPVSHIIALIPINILSSVVGTIGNSLVIARSQEFTDYSQLLVGEYGCGRFDGHCFGSAAAYSFLGASCKSRM